MAQRDVSQLLRQHHGQAGLIGKHVDQAAADRDGVADRKGLERSGQQHAALGVDGQVARDNQIVDYRVQHFLDVAFG